MRQTAGQALKGWRVYPLQLEDLSPLSYSSAKARTGQVGDEATVTESIQLQAPAAEETGPIFYRCCTSRNSSPSSSFAIHAHILPLQNPSREVSIRLQGLTALGSAMILLSDRNAVCLVS